MKRGLKPTVMALLIIAMMIPTNKIKAENYPKGTIVETSRGLGIVADTGTFVSNYPEGFDIAVDW